MDSVNYNHLRDILPNVGGREIVFPSKRLSQESSQWENPTEGIANFWTGKTNFSPIKHLGCEPIDSHFFLSMIILK
jgi:hypothetical protein